MNWEVRPIEADHSYWRHRLLQLTERSVPGGANDLGHGHLTAAVSGSAAISRRSIEAVSAFNRPTSTVAPRRLPIGQMGFGASMAALSLTIAA
jgi:hypothetical protein